MRVHSEYRCWGRGKVANNMTKLLLLIVVVCVVFGTDIPQTGEIQPVLIPTQQVHISKITDYTNESTQDTIRRLAKIYRFPEDTALRIGYCESRFNPTAKNRLSSASGLFQFTRTTWENYCEGDVFDKEDNTICFLELYPTHPYWWECK